MGCGESKLAVATSNTILRRKKSNVGGDSAKKSKDIETPLETATNHDNSVENPDVHQQQQHEKSAAEISSSSVENAGVNVGGGDETTSSVVVDVKDINEDDNNDNEKKEIDDEAENKEEEEVGTVSGGGVTVVDEDDDHDQQEPERLVSHGSPNRFFSTRKLDEEGLNIDGIISEGQSGASDYYTPRHASKRNLYFKVDNTAEDKQVLAAEQTKPADDQAQNFNEEPVKVEEKLVKEAEKEITTTTGPVEADVSGPVEAKVSGPAEEEKKESEDSELKSGI